MTYQQAAANLPQDAYWSASFGYPGCDNYSEYHRDPRGNRWEISRANHYDDNGWIIAAR